MQLIAGALHCMDLLHVYKQQVNIASNGLAQHVRAALPTRAVQPTDCSSRPTVYMVPDISMSQICRCTQYEKLIRDVLKLSACNTNLASMSRFRQIVKCV